MATSSNQTQTSLIEKLQDKITQTTDDSLSITITSYDIGKKTYIKHQHFIHNSLSRGATIFGGYLIFEIKKSYFTNLFYNYCIKEKLDYKRNFNNTECHPESKFRMLAPFQNKSDIDMYIQQKDVEKLINYFKSQYEVIELNTQCSYFIGTEIRRHLEFKKLKLLPKMSEEVSSSLNALLCIKKKETLFPHKFIDLIIIKNNSTEKAPFNCPDFKCNQLFMYWSKIEERIIISQNSSPFTSMLSFIDQQNFVVNTLDTIKQQCIDNIAELCKDTIPHLHRVLKMLMKGYTIKIPLETIPGALGHKYEIPKEKKTEHKCAICYDDFKEDTIIMYPCSQCAAPYHINCYVMFYMDSVKNHNKKPDCPNCRVKIIKDNCAFVNMVFLINNYNEYVKTNDICNFSGICFTYCKECKSNSPTKKVPSYINNRLIIKYL